MNREEAIKFFELQTQDEQALIDGINLNPDDFVFGAEGPEQYINDCQNNIDAYNTAITALRGPQPDPITGLVPCGCGGKLVLHKCPDREYMTTFYVECDNEECGLSVGRRYDPINHCRRGEFTDTKSAIEASNRAMGYIPVELSTPMPEVEE